MCAYVLATSFLLNLSLPTTYLPRASSPGVVSGTGKRGGVGAGKVGGISRPEGGADRMGTTRALLAATLAAGLAAGPCAGRAGSAGAAA